MEKLLISNSPHIRAAASTKRIMLDVIIALIPAFIMGCLFFGWKALVVVIISIIACVLSEIVYDLIFKKDLKTIIKKFDFTSVVTGLLLGLNLPSTVPFYVPVIGAIFAIVVVKMLFGGTGKNFVNPAIAARVFLIISFPIAMTSGFAATNIGTISESSLIAGETVLGKIISGDFASTNISLLDLFLGTGISGSIGETCKLALILGGIYLCIRKVINWIYPTIYIFLTGLMSVILGGSFQMFLPSILSGGLILGAIFMATDYVTSPNTLIGNLVYFGLLGIVTGALRFMNGSECVSYVIMLMNLAVPLIDRLIVPKPFGYEKPKKLKEKETK